MFILLFNDTEILNFTSGMKSPIDLEARRTGRFPPSPPINRPQGIELIGYGLLEVELLQNPGNIKVDLSIESLPARPNMSETIILYGQFEDIDLGMLAFEERWPVGLFYRATWFNDNPGVSMFRVRVTVRNVPGAPAMTEEVDIQARPNVPSGVRFPPALFEFNSPTSNLPELRMTPRTPNAKKFNLTTLNHGLPVDSVNFELVPVTPKNGDYQLILNNGAPAINFKSPSGPDLEASFSGRPAQRPKPEAVFIEAKNVNGVQQKVPFIFFMLDTPVRGELMIKSIDPDAKGRNEFVELVNTGTRDLFLTDCTLEDEQPMALGWGSGRIPLNLPLEKSNRVSLSSLGMLAVGQSKKINTGTMLNSDYDCVVLRNRFGHYLDSAAYIRSLGGVRVGPAPIATTIVFSDTILVDAREPFFEVRIPELDDGDVIIVAPVTTSLLGVGEIGMPVTGPAGWVTRTAPLPPNWDPLPLPSAPVFALLYSTDTDSSLRLLGSSTLSVTTDRETNATTGFRGRNAHPFNSTSRQRGTSRIFFSRNDPYYNRAFSGTGGPGFLVTVTIMRH